MPSSKPACATIRSCRTLSGSAFTAATAASASASFAAAAFSSPRSRAASASATCSLASAAAFLPPPSFFRLPSAAAVRPCSRDASAAASACTFAAVCAADARGSGAGSAPFAHASAARADRAWGYIRSSL